MIVGKGVQETIQQRTYQCSKEQSYNHDGQRIRTSARTFGTPLRCNQNKGGVQMTAMNIARKRGTRMDLAVFIPATTMIKQARVIDYYLTQRITGRLFHDQIILYGCDPFDAPCDLNRCIHSLLRINEAAQLNNALVGFHTDTE